MINNNGQKLSKYLRDILDVMEPTLAQQADMNQVLPSAMFSPDDLELAILDVQILFTENNINELIKLYRKLPRPTEGSKNQQYQLEDGSKVSFIELLALPEHTPFIPLGENRAIADTPLKAWKAEQLRFSCRGLKLDTRIKLLIAQGFIRHSQLHNVRLFTDLENSDELDGAFDNLEFTNYNVFVDWYNKWFPQTPKWEIEHDA